MASWSHETPLQLRIITCHVGFKSFGFQSHGHRPSTTEAKRAIGNQNEYLLFTPVDVEAYINDYKCISYVNIGVFSCHASRAGRSTTKTKEMLWRLA